MSGFSPVERTSVATAVFDQIAARILDGTLPAGERLPPERALTEEFGVNRQALREALQRLDQLGLVEIRHGGATRVRDFRRTAGLDLLPRLFLGADGGIDAEVVRSVMEMRTAIGADAASLAAARATSGVRAGLRETVADLESLVADGGADDVAALAALDVRFWDLLVEGSGNVCYRLSLNVLRDAYRPVGALVDLLVLDERRDVPAHRDLVAAVEAGDAGRARARAAALLDQGRIAVLSHFTEEDPG
ncbi:FadR/GntR family transcriptional regulator [Actinomadura rupiterrae]|uniref:FadR/GntR family transcriptional regulator n=1 Tax=Actinomadura rupiterrae TaxID=559627 RepID=UPI0020A42823|nr:GntR family transcriptional regulator [Actinomadura rupiterrae]MCP2339613.1 DNA-binding FadR family transcriptional regulator [Actinomadura rupiterrae]